MAQCRKNQELLILTFVLQLSVKVGKKIFECKVVYFTGEVPKTRNFILS